MKRFILSISAGICLFFAGQAFGNVPKQMNYQGILSGSTGNPLADSTVDVEFRIYNAPSGGSSVWSETVTVTTDDEGRFNVTLGLTNPIEDTVFRETERYLSINVESSGEMPRLKLTSVGYANRISTVEGAKGGTVSGGVDVIRSAGLEDRIVLGVDDPNVALELRSGTFGGDPYIDLANDAAEDYDARIQLNGEKGLEITVDSSVLIPQGKVGIGNSTPNAKLDVFNLVSSTSTELGVSGTVTNTSSGSAFGGFFTAGSAGSGSKTGVRGNASATSASPSYGVYGEADNSSTGEAFGAYFNVPTSGGIGAVYGIRANAFGTTGASASVYGGFFFTDGSGGGTNYGVYATAPTSAGYAGYFAGNARVSDTLFASNVSSLSPLRLQTAGTTRMYIDDVSGMVGIGTTAPTSHLHVEGNIHVSGKIGKEYSIGTSNMAVPIAYANINSSGTVDAGTPNVSCVWDGTNQRFDVTIAGETYTGTGYITIVTPLVTAAPDALFATTGSGSGNLRVRIMSSSTGTTGLQRAFQFITYKP